MPFRRHRKIHIKERQKKSHKPKKTLQEKWRSYSAKKKALIVITGLTKIISLGYAIFQFI